MSSGAEARGLARYRELLAREHASALLATSILARMPTAMPGLALVLLVRAGGGGYDKAGLVAAAYGVGVAIGGPYGGRRVDRVGARTVLLRRMVLYPSFLGLVALLGELGAPAGALAAAAAAAGLTMAPVGAVVRSIWPAVAGSDGVRTAYALDAALQEVIFIGGPLLVAALAVISPVTAVIGAAVIAVIGTYAFWRLAPVQAAGPAAVTHNSPLGALSSVGVRTIVLFCLFLGIGFGAVEIAVPAFAEDHGDRAFAGVALAGFATGSLVGGLLAALRPSRDERRRIIVGSVALAASLSLPLLARSPWTLVLLLFLAGLPIAPVIAAVYGQIGRVAAQGSVAEAFSWFATSVTIGIAVGTLVGGALIDEHGWRAGVVLGAASLALGGGVTAMRRSTLAAPAWGN